MVDQPLLMKKFIFFLLSFILLIFPNHIAAYSEAEETCYAQCATYKFVWQGDYCYDTFQQQCAIGKGQTIRETIKFLKGVHSTISSGGGIDNVFKAWFVCKPLIENCIVPQLRECRNTCSEDPVYYAPDISVGHPYGNFAYHGVVYNDRYHTLTFKVVNNGVGYAWNIDADASWGHTRDRDGVVSRGGQLFAETIPELLYAGARNGPPKTVGDYIGDFLIEESNFAKYLQDFKSDADNYDVPAIWYKTISFTPPEGELTKVTFNVDSSQMITERSELNNSFVLVIDKLPTPPSFQIENFTQVLENNTLNNFLIDFKIKNTGEENGEVTVKIFEDQYNNTNSQTPIYSSNQVVQGLNIFNFSTFITPNISEHDNYCGRFQKYELVAFDQTEKVDSHQFSLPLYSGSIRGKVKDLFDNNVAGAIITTSSGQSTTTNEYGNYHLSGINQLGKVLITVTHPDFSQTETRELEFKIVDPNNPCAENSLTFNQLNFTLQDQATIFTVIVKDSFGNPLSAHVLATNSDWRFDEDIVNGESPLPGMQPGEYFFTISAPGYKTIGQTVNAVPAQQTLEFILDKLNGRETDGGLNIHEPQLLWEFNRGNEIIHNVTATKDGKLVIYYAINTSNKTAKLYFVDLKTGAQIAAVPVAVASGTAHNRLDTSYDGNTTCLSTYLNSVRREERRNVLKLFNNQGETIGSTELNSGHNTQFCEVSPDGFYIYSGQLLNKGLYQYTNREILGDQHNTAPMTMSEPHFTTSNNRVGLCSHDDGNCVETFNKSLISYLGTLDGYKSGLADSSQTGSNIAVITIKNAYFFGNGQQLWQKDVVTKGDSLDISVSPGGKYVIYSTFLENRNHRTIKIYSDNNLDKTPSGIPDPSTEDVLFVHANDEGMFFMTNVQKKIKFYQVANYSTDYNPITPPPAEEGQLYEDSLSYYDNGVWRGVNHMHFYSLLPWKIYMANDDLNFEMNDPYGTLRIKDGTLFGVDVHHHPILLKGQMTAEFNSPAILYALKFDRYDLELFRQKLSQFIAGNLPQAEYFIIQNIHTKFILKNKENQVDVVAVTGAVQITGQDVAETVSSGQQLSIDENNQIKNSIYLGLKLYLIIFAVISLIVGVALYHYRTTKVGATIISILKKIGTIIIKYGVIILLFSWKYFKKTIIWFWQMIKIIVPILWQWLKRVVIFLQNLFKKIFQAKKN